MLVKGGPDSLAPLGAVAAADNVMSKHGCFIYTVEGLTLMRCYSVLLALCARKFWITRPIWNTEKNDILCVINQQELRRSYSQNVADARLEPIMFVLSKTRQLCVYIAWCRYSDRAIFAFNVAGLVVIISSKNFLKLGSDFYDLMDNIRYLFNIEYIKRIT